MLDLDALEQILQDRLAAAAIAGFALAIIQGRDIVRVRGFGRTSVEEGGVPVTPSTLFRIASLTTPLTGTAVMRLVDAGKADLDRPIRAYVPWFRLSAEDASERVTL